MGAGAVSGHSSARSNQVYPSTPLSSATAQEGPVDRRTESQPGVSQSPRHETIMSNRVQSCETCDNTFNFFKRRKVCRDCRRVFCSTCLPKPPSGLGRNGRQCTKCNILTSGKFTRAQLQAWRIKDMRCFLDGRNIPTATCKEKHDLIDLLLLHFCLESNTALTEQHEHDRLVGELADRMRNSSFHVSPSLPHQVPDADSDNPQPSSSQVSQSTPASQPTPSQSGTSMTGDGQSGPATFGSSQSVPASQSSPADTITGQSASLATETGHSGPVGQEEGEEAGEADDDAVNEAGDDDAGNEDEDDEMSNLSSILSGHLRERQEREMREMLHRLQEELSPEEPESRPGIQRASIDDITCEEDAEGLTVRQLKEILVNNFVDYRGCCEKRELVDRVKRLWLEKQANKQRVAASLGTPATEDVPAPKSDASDSAATETTGGASGAPHDPEKDVCKICMDAAIDCILLECGHMITCTKCGKRLADCPICRQYITRVVHVFRS